MRILLPIDGSFNSDTALQAVLNEPWPKDTLVCVMTVAEPFHKIVDVAMLGIGEMAKHAQKALDEDIRKVLSEAADKLKAKFGAGKVTEVFREGGASEQILETAGGWSPDLIIMGSHGTGGYNDDMLGSITAKVIAHAFCSVRVIHCLSTKTLEKKLAAQKPLVESKLLLAFDESANAQVALKTVLDRPWSEGTSIQILTVIHKDSKGSNSRFFQATAIGDAEKQVHSTAMANAEKLLAGVASKLENKFGKGKVTYHVLEGNARSLILQIAQDSSVDLIIMGAYARGNTVMQHLFGSTTAAVVSNTECSVELVR